MVFNGEQRSKFPFCCFCCIHAISHLHIRRAPLVDECLDTTIRVKEEVFGMTLVDAEIRVDEEVIATAEMKMAIP